MVARSRVHDVPLPGPRGPGFARSRDRDVPGPQGRVIDSLLWMMRLDIAVWGSGKRIQEAHVQLSQRDCTKRFTSFK